MFYVYTEVKARDDTVTFEYNLSFSFYLCLRLTSPNNAFMRCHIYRSFYTCNINEVLKSTNEN